MRCTLVGFLYVVHCWATVCDGDVIAESFLSFTRSYTAITKERNILFASPDTNGSVTAGPEGGPFTRDGPTLLGSFFIQFGGLYRPSSVKLLPRIKTAIFFLSGQREFTDESLELQPEVIPAIDQDFTFGGKCTVTSSQFGRRIVGHSCLYDLCLGSSTDCIFVYAGTRFEFIPTTADRGSEVGAQNKGLLDPTTTNQGFTGNNPNFAANRLQLPPSFPGFVFGGVGNYEGIKGSFDLITVAQRRANPAFVETDTPTAAPTLTDAPTPDFQRRRDLQEENEERTTATKDDAPSNDIEEENNTVKEDQRDLQRIVNDDGVVDDNVLADFDDNENVIVQKIFLVTNIRLPLGPKAI
jgi:hypothetical protein